MPELVGVHHVSLSVSDRDRSAAWYAEVLGFVELLREDGELRRAAVMRFPGGGYSVGLTEHLPVDEAGFDPRHRGLDHVAFTVADRAGLDEWARRLDEAGIEHSGVVTVPVGAILNFRDPDGIALALFWDA